MSKLTATHPQAGVGAVVFHDNKVLLVKRLAPPRQGEWAIPGGKINPGETLQKAAEREIQEETGIIIRARDAIYSFDLIEKDSNGVLRYHYVIVDLAADYVRGALKAASDASAAGWFSQTELATLNLNKTTRHLLQRYPTFVH